jgi:hypothetical protein
MNGLGLEVGDGTLAGITYTSGVMRVVEILPHYKLESRGRGRFHTPVCPELEKLPSCGCYISTAPLASLIFTIKKRELDAGGYYYTTSMEV